MDQREHQHRDAEQDRNGVQQAAHNKDPHGGVPGNPPVIPCKPG